MTSSGMKRGLAVSAVTALAVTGLPFLTVSANAAPLEDQVGGVDQVLLYTQYNAGNEASVKPDGTNATISLVAGAGEDIDSVQFSYSLDGTTWVPIATVPTRNADGAFTTEWAGTGVIGGTVTLRAQAFDGVTLKDTDTRSGVEIMGPGATMESVNLNEGSDETGSGEAGNLGVFQQPYTSAGQTSNLAVVSGTTSATSGDVVLSTRSGGATGTTSAPVTKANPTDTTGIFSGVLNLNGSPFTAGNTNQVAIGAERDTDDVEDYTLYRQVITSVTTSGDESVPAGSTAQITITVVDQYGNPIAGAQVYDDADDTLVGYTDKKGQVVDTASEGTHSYYANADNAPAYSAGAGDKAATPVVVSGYAPVATSTSAASNDGNVFDLDEYTVGDITVTVEDQNSNPMSGATVEYYWEFDANDGDPVSKRIPAGTTWSTATTDADGEATIAFPMSETETGDYTLHYQVPNNPSTGTGGVAEKSDLTVEAGESELTVDDTDMEKDVPAASTTSVVYNLSLIDGSALPGRDASVVFQRGTEKAPADGVADAGIVDEQDATKIVLSETYTTDSTGNFTVDVKDPAETGTGAQQGSELGGNLDASTINTPDLGNAQETLNNYEVNFVSANSIGEVELEQTRIINDTEGGVATPGRPVVYKITVSDDTGAPKSGNTTVNVDFDNGMLFENDADGDPVAEGTESGDYKAAASQTTVTAVNGIAYITWGMERETGFDDDGMVTDTITATVGSLSDSDTETFYSGNEQGAINPANGQSVGDVDPLNAGSVDLEFADDQESAVLPKAAVGKTVYFDLFAMDQFGNLVKADVDISDGNSPAFLESNQDWGTNNIDAYSQFTGENPAVWAMSGQATNQTVFSNWTDRNSETVSDASPETINWYEVNYDASSFTMSNNTGDNRVTVGTAVTERVVALDQEGQPIAGLNVEFIRSGPNEQQGDVNATRTTNSNGVAIYSYVGDAAGSATVSAVISDNGTVLEQLSNTVVFEADAPARRRISAGLSMSNNRFGNDVAFVNAPNAARNAMVRLYKVRSNGTKVLIRSKRANQAGNARFVVGDPNKRTFTRYQARVLRTARTFADRTPIRRIR